MFEDLLSAGTDLGKQYLKQEIADHGNQQPQTRPAGTPVVVQQQSPIKIDKKTMIIGGGVLVGILVLGFVFKG